jgi:uncharacterized protein YxeA
MKKILLLLVMVVAMITNIALGQQLKYNPISGLGQNHLKKIIEQNKVVVSADANSSSEYEVDYGFMVLSKGEKAIVLFNYDCEAYVLVVHKILPAINGSTLYPYGRILFPDTFIGNGPRLSLEELEDKFEASIFKLTPQSISGAITMLTD